MNEEARKKRRRETEKKEGSETKEDGEKETERKRERERKGGRERGTGNLALSRRLLSVWPALPALRAPDGTLLKFIDNHKFRK